MSLALPSIFRDDGYSSLIVGGIATPTAWKTLPQTPLLITLHSVLRTLAVFFYRYRLQGLEVLFDFSPLKAMAGCFQAPIKFLAQYKSQKAAKDMAPDGPVMAMVDRTGFKKRLHISKDPFNLP